MNHNFKVIETPTPFSQSKIWKLNQDFYKFTGMTAFNEDIVPHHLTSNALVGKLYALLIFGFLQDLALKGRTKEKVYILELGAGHGRLAFLIMTELKTLLENDQSDYPEFCYILSDITEKNLTFFENHPQFQQWFNEGSLEVSYFDALESETIQLRKSNQTISPGELEVPIICLANYFFDSIPNDLFKVKDKVISSCLLSLSTKRKTENLNPQELIDNLIFNYSYTSISEGYYSDPIKNEILSDYKDVLTNSHVFFPNRGMDCIYNLKKLSKEGMLLISLDKGFHEPHDLENIAEPDIVRHGSFSVWVNYHALIAHCEKLGGTALMPSYSTFHLDLGAFFYMDDSEEYYNTRNAYLNFVDVFGPDDFNTIKHMTYQKTNLLSTSQILALIRLSGYDSTYFIQLVPRLKEVVKEITFNERTRIYQMLQKVWSKYFRIGETYDLASEIGGILYDLGFYKEGLFFFKYSLSYHANMPGTYYNIALSYYQLREDRLFFQTLTEAKAQFPNFEQYDELFKLDMS